MSSILVLVIKIAAIQKSITQISVKKQLKLSLFFTVSCNLIKNSLVMRGNNVKITVFYFWLPENLKSLQIMMIIIRNFVINIQSNSLNTTYNYRVFSSSLLSHVSILSHTNHIRTHSGNTYIWYAQQLSHSFASFSTFFWKIIKFEDYLNVIIGYQFLYWLRLRAITKKKCNFSWFHIFFFLGASRPIVS